MKSINPNLFKNIPAQNRDGFCLCGCGQKTRIAKVTRNDRGDIKGFPVRYLPSHNAKDPDWRKRVNEWTRPANWEGGYIKHNGYILRHKSTFTQEEYELLKPMFSTYHKRGLYILEHRALIALQEGRVLSKVEFVRHLDGNRENNTLENLMLGSAKDNYLDHDSARKEVIKLRNEKEILKRKIRELEWRLHAGKDAKVVYEISDKDLKEVEHG